MIHAHRDALVFIVTVICGCTSLLPMTGEIELPESEVKRIVSITKLTPEQVRDKTIHETHEIKLSFWQVVQECAPGVSWWMWALGSIPMACTKIIQNPWNEKTALIYYSWATDSWTREHERRHAKGETHAAW